MELLSIATLARISIAAAIPAAFWLYVYRRKDWRDPEPVWACARAFWYGIIAALPLAIIGVLEYTQGDILGGLLAWLTRHVSGAIVFNIIVFSMIAIIEELVKAFATTRAIEKSGAAFNQGVDGVIYASAAALGFSFIENIVYFMIAAGESELFSVFVIRSGGATLAHTLFSGAFGYCYAKAHLCPDVIPPRSTRPAHQFLPKLKEALSLHVFRTHILAQRPSKTGHSHRLLVAEGFIIAVILHLIYDLIVATGVFGEHMTALIVPLLMGGLIGISVLFSRPSDVRIIHRIQQRPAYSRLARLCRTGLCLPEIRSGRITQV